MGVVALLVGAALLVPVGWATVAELRDERPVIIDQGGVPDAVLASVKAAHLADRKIAAGPDEVASHKPWARLKRYKAAADPFGPPPPPRLKELPRAGAAPRNRAPMLGHGKNQAAPPRVKQGLAAAPDNLALRYARARVLHSQGELEAAHQELYRVGEQALGMPRHGSRWPSCSMTSNARPPWPPANAERRW